MPTPTIHIIPSRRLVGKSIRTSLAQNQTVSLWSSFMPLLPDVPNKANDCLYSVQSFDQLLSFSDFSPQTVFETWAAVEVNDFAIIPEGMGSIEVEGMYALFIYKGLHAHFNRFLSYVYGEWMPQSDYELDLRPHFEVMKPGYRPDDPEAEEEIWIPVKMK